MPPKRGRGRRGRGPGHGGARIDGGGGHANSKEALAPPSQWPHLKKQKPEPLAPLAGNAFLSLEISSLASRVAEIEWPLKSNQAAIYLSRNPENELKQFLEPQEASNVPLEKPDQHSQETQVQQTVVNRNAAFLTLKFGTFAWERSQTPLAQAWRSVRTVSTSLAQDQGPRTVFKSNPTELVNRAWSPSPLPSNELELATRRLIRSRLLALNAANNKIGDTGHTSPNAPDFSPLTPIFIESSHPLYLADPEGSDSSPLHTDTDHLYLSDSYDMSAKPPIDAGGVNESIKDVIQNLFIMQQHVASFRPEQQDGLNRKVEDIAASLQKLDDLVTAPNNPIHSIKVAPDIIDYVDDGRNPDIYTRDFVELVQRGNVVLNGKQKAFRNFSKIYAKALKDNFEGMDDEVDMIMDNAGMEERNGTFIERQQNGSSS